MVHARGGRDLDVASVARIGVGQRDVARPVVALGVQVDDERIRRRALPEALVARRERVGNWDEGERIVLRWPLVLLVLARIAADLGEALVLEDPAAARAREA